jgi:hypothetical protein
MPTYEVTSPDGKTWEVTAPEGATQAQVLDYAKQQWSAQQKAPAPVPASVQAGRSLSDIPRQLGLTARYGAEGLAGLAETVTEPVRYLAQKAGLMKNTLPLSAAVSDLATRVGLPQPQTADERVVGDAARLVAGSAGGAGLLGRAAQAAPETARQVMTQMAARPGIAAVSAAGSGLAGGSVRESGGGPMAQFGASLAGGLAAPALAAGVGSAANAARSGVRSALLSPSDIDARLSVEFGKAGVNWADLGANVKAQLREDARKAVASGENLDAKALRRLADFRNIGATPMLGDITQDPGLLTRQRNLAKQLANTEGFGGADLPNIQNQNARRVLSTLEGASTSADDSYATAQRIIGQVTSKDAALQAQERALYGVAENQGGRKIPLDRAAFVNEAFSNLAKKNKMAFLPEEIGTMLNQISEGQIKRGGQTFNVPFDVDVIDNLKTMLAAASRGTSDGNKKAAIAAVRDAVENIQPRVPAFGGSQLATPQQAAALRAGDPAAQAMGAFDTARSFARSRREWQQSAGFIEDALGGATPDKFVQKHIIGAPVEELAKLRKEIGGPGISASREVGQVNPNATAGGNGETLESVRKQLVSYILERGRADSDTTSFSSAGMKDALKAIGDRKLELFFSSQEIQSLKSAVNVGRYMQSQPIGSAVNNSNTGAMLLGRLSSVLDRASPLPIVGPMVAQPLQGGLLQMQARGMRNLSQGLLAPQAPVPSMIPSLAIPGLLSIPNE